MIINRWQAPILPTLEQILMIFEREDLKAIQEIYQPNDKVKNHTHPFDEVRIIVTGSLLIDVTGNQLLLRTGDKIIIPSNTTHSTQVQGDKPCVCVCAYKV